MSLPPYEKRKGVFFRGVLGYGQKTCALHRKNRLEILKTDFKPIFCFLGAVTRSVFASAPKFSVFVGAANFFAALDALCIRDYFVGNSAQRVKFSFAVKFYIRASFRVPEEPVPQLSSGFCVNREDKLCLAVAAGTVHLHFVACKTAFSLI